MLRFEREFVTALVSSADPRRQSEVEAFVDGALQSMPEHLRAGVIAESLVLGVWAKLLGATRRDRRETLRARLNGWEASRVGPVRDYVRMLRSLVLFAEHELSPETAMP